MWTKVHQAKENRMLTFLAIYRYHINTDDYSWEKIEAKQTLKDKGPYVRAQGVN